MRPALIDQMSWEMAEVYGAVTDQILINLAHYFPYYNAQNFPRSSITYQADMLAQMGKVNKETIAIIRKNLVGASPALSNCLEQVIIDSVRAVNPELWQAVKKGIFMPPTKPVLAPNQYRAFQLYYTQAANKLNLVNTVMLESTQQAYRETVADIAARVQATQTALDIGAGEVVTGVSTWNQATAHAINRMKENGITGFIDHGGHRWSAEAYVAMDIRTTMFNTGRAAVWETNQDFGNDLYQVSYHNGARPLCYPWQNKVISSTDNARTVVDLDGNEVQVYAQSATTYGQPAGLFGINCKHYPNPFIPGVSVIRGTPQNEEDNAKAYEESQEQRALERKIREEKRDLMMLKAQGAPDDVIKAQRAKIRQTDDDIDAFCDATGRHRRQNREGVYTERRFPAAETYDVAEFERTQKDLVNDFYKSGGTQGSYTFGQMAQNEQEKKRKTFDELKKEYNERQKAKGKLKAPTAQTAPTATNAEDARKKAIESYTKQIEELERKRMRLIESGSDDFATSDKLYSDAEKIREKLKIVEGGGWTLDQAKKTQGRFVANPGNMSEIVLDKADVYEMPDGMRFVFKHNMNKANQTLKIDTLIDGYYKTPQELREKAQKTIVVVDRYNPADSYWKKKYKNFPRSYMTGGEMITIYRYEYEHDFDYLLEALRHEMGHAIDRNNKQGNAWFSELGEWTEAMRKDKEFSGGIAESVSEYGKNSPKEDFADSVSKITGSATAFASAFPNRAAILKRLIWGR